MSTGTPPRQPTPEECNTKAEVDGGQAFWFPQLGGYVGKAVARVDKCCIDVWVWHDGQFPFDESDPWYGRPPVHLHMDDGDDWIRFGEFVSELQDAAEESG